MNCNCMVNRRFENFLRIAVNAVFAQKSGFLRQKNGLKMSF